MLSSRQPCIAPNRIPQIQHTVRTAVPIDTTYYTGKTIILFTMFFCGLQWAYYRQLYKSYKDKRKDNE
jgi:hypothetical protein